MSQAKYVFEAQTRERAGKGAARAVRREGRVPAVIYGDSKEPVKISLEERELVKVMGKGGFFTHIMEIKADGKSHQVLARDVQYHPVTDRAEHIDFLRVSDKTKIAVMVPARFINEKASPGLSRGGILNIVRHEIEVFCSATNIPEAIEFDLTGLDVGESIHISSITLPAGVKPTEERDFTVATVAAPSALRSKDGAEAAEGEEGETEGEDAAEGEEASSDEE